MTRYAQVAVLLLVSFASLAFSNDLKADVFELTNSDSSSYSSDVLRFEFSSSELERDHQIDRIQTAVNNTQLDSSSQATKAPGKSQEFLEIEEVAEPASLSVVLGVIVIWCASGRRRRPS